MFKAFYGFTFNPFNKEIATKYSYNFYDFSEATARLKYISEIKGFGLFIGESGMGKTFTIRNFLNSLNPNLFKTVYINISTLTVMDFYRAICLGLGIDPQCKKVQMFYQIQETIKTLVDNKNLTPIIVLDEAQYLSPSILNDLKLLFNFNIDSKNYAAVILTGNSVLNTILQRQTHDALRQRITINYSFLGITPDEVKKYIPSMLHTAGAATNISIEDAIELFCNNCSGSIRKLNAFIEKSLIIGYQKKALAIDSEIVYIAQKELDF